MANEARNSSSPSGSSAAPVAEPISSFETFGAPGEGPTGGPTVPLPAPGPATPIPPIPLLGHCHIDVKEGCYAISFAPHALTLFLGTLRVDRHGGSLVVSGDLYRFALVTPVLPTHLIPAPGIPPLLPLRPLIPIYPRNRYYSYLKITSVNTLMPKCQLVLTAEEYVYTHPPAGSFNGTFPPAPGSRTVTIVLEPRLVPPLHVGPHFEGKLFEGGVDKGAFRMTFVSKYFRRATLEIDTLRGSVAPAAVPASSGTGTEEFRTVMKTAGWDLRVIRDQVDILVPAGVTPTNCWSSADLHALMLSVRKPTTNLDKEWRIHLVVVPAKMGCGRGVMYDQIDLPREGVASFSNDGYPPSDSSNFGAATNQQQRNVPRAFMRSASHEVGHGFNQVHQEGEGGADNSIMTTTPSVADVLGGPASGEPGVFPDNINLGFNEHVRHHLVHFPDPVVRPGGMTFGSGHSPVVPEADRHYFDASELELRLGTKTAQIELGEPLELSWVIENHSSQPIPVPSDVGIETRLTNFSVTAPAGKVKEMPSFVIRCESATIRDLPPGESLEASTRLFWSSHGFAFETPGKHVVALRMAWTANGVPFGAKSSVDVWVNYPQSTADNDAAATLLDPQVGMYVALGGGAHHLTEAVARLRRVADFAKGDRGAARCVRGYAGLMPPASAGAPGPRARGGAERRPAARKATPRRARRAR